MNKTNLNQLPFTEGKFYSRDFIEEYADNDGRYIDSRIEEDDFMRREFLSFGNVKFADTEDIDIFICGDEFTETLNN